jgi:hypothetical protein
MLRKLLELLNPPEIDEKEIWSTLMGFKDNEMCENCFFNDDIVICGDCQGTANPVMASTATDGFCKVKEGGSELDNLRTKKHV